MFVNIAVSLSCLFFVHVRGIAPYKFGLYLFYGITLCLPSFYVCYRFKPVSSSNFSFTFSGNHDIGDVMGAVCGWLPYHWHGTFDFLGGGVPNLFSDVTGHVGLGNYLLHRGSYFC